MADFVNLEPNHNESHVFLATYFHNGRNDLCVFDIEEIDNSADPTYMLEQNSPAVDPFLYKDHYTLSGITPWTRHLTQLQPD